MKPILSIWLRIFAAWGVFVFAAAAPAHALVVLQYHHVSDETPKSTSVTPARFAMHMDWLEENNYSVVAMPQLLQWLDQGKPLPDKAVVITFDDGYISIYDKAWPILKEHGWPFTVFVNSQHHDEKNRLFMSWAQLQEMVGQGVTIGNHSVSHEHLVRKLKDETDKQWRTRVTHEIVGAQKRIDQNLSAQPQVFAYPYGEYNQALQRILDKLGYVAFGQQSGPVASFDPITALPRFPFGGNYGAKEDFAAKVSSQPMPIDGAALVDESGAVLVDPLLPAEVQKPVLRLTGANEILSRINCFAGGTDVNISRTKGQLLVQVSEPFPVGRSRYNCTAPAKDGYYWYSKLIIKRHADGQWYEE